MIINVNYGNQVIALPSIIKKALDNATIKDIKVLLAISESSGRIIDADELANKLAMPAEEVRGSLDFWENEKVISVYTDQIASEAEKATEQKEEKTKTTNKKSGTTIVRRSDEIPRYTSDELAVILEKRKETSHLIDECQQTFGKMFNTHEINILLGMVDYLALGWDYVVELLEFCARNGKHSLNYVERMAFSMMDEGIYTVDALKEKLKALDRLKDNESFVRKLFGMKSRAFTAKEKKCVTAWFGKLELSKELITKAYELTVSSTNEPSIPYANAILERWASEGIKTVEEVEKAEDERRAQMQSDSNDGSFDTDDFFESALQRSYNKK